MKRVIDDVACTMCGCVCDDLRLAVEDGRIVEAWHACELALPDLLAPPDATRPPAQIGDSTATVSDAICHAAGILSASRAPLIYGLSRSSTAGQRAAVRLADRLGATIDTTASTCHAPSIMAVQNVGESTATLGEVRNRSDLVVYWGSNPLVTHPRHLERCVEAPGMLVPRGREDRHVVVVDVERTETADIADTFIQVPPGGDFELIWALRGLCRIDHADDDSARPWFLPDNVAGVGWQEVVRLAERFKQSRYGALFFGLGLTRHGVAHANVEALLKLVTDLNAHTRFIARRMRVPGDVAGADSVLCWQTGFPFSVNLARGFPRYNPGEYTAGVLLERGEVDAVVLVGSDDTEKLSDAARRHLAAIPSIVLDRPGAEAPFAASVTFRTAVYGIHRPGTAYRMDEVPIPLRAVTESPLASDDEILNGIGASLGSLSQAAGVS